MLSFLMDMGTWLVRALIRQAAPGMNDPKWTGPRVAFPDRCNPVTIFARAARAVHLAVALRLKIQQQIADLRAGKFLTPVTPASKAKAPQISMRAELPDDDRGEATSASDRDRETTLNAGAGDVEAVEELQDSMRSVVLPREGKARRPESDRFHRLLNGPLKDAVAAICADLGLRPDWSLWTEDGFPPPPGGDVRVWDIFRSPETQTPPPPDRGDSGDDAAQIVWRPRWRQPPRSRAKPPLDPRYDRGPATWRDFNDFYFNDVLKKGESHEL